MKETRNIMGEADKSCPTRKRGLGRNRYKEMWCLIWDLKDVLSLNEDGGGIKMLQVEGILWTEVWN